MAKNPILPLYYNDIDRSTRTWSDEEFGAYMRLLFEQWDKGYLPNDYQKLTRVATSLDTNWNLLKDKFPLVDGVLKNPRMEEIREKQNKHKQKQKENAEKRYQKPAKPTAKKMPLEDESENEFENQDRKEGVEEREGIMYPFESETFKANWMAWRKLLRDKHDKDYFNRESEQAALVNLSRLTKSEDQAIQIIQQSLSNNWKDLYKLKTDGTNKLTGTEKRDQSKQDTSDSVARYYQERLASEEGGTGI